MNFARIHPPQWHRPRPTTIDQIVRRILKRSQARVRYLAARIRVQVALDTWWAP